MIAAVVAHLAQEGNRWFSCLIDPDSMGTWRRKDAKGRLTPKFRIELPGPPILGNGKSDNQNCALPFTRGSILQAPPPQPTEQTPGRVAVGLGRLL